MSDLHVTPGNEGFGLINHIQALDERVGRLEMLLGEKFVPDNAVFYIDQTTDGHFTLSKNGAVIGSFPSRTDAEKAEALARG